MHRLCGKVKVCSSCFKVRHYGSAISISELPVGLVGGSPITASLFKSSLGQFFPQTLQAFFFQNTLPNKTHACETLSHRVSRVYESLPKGFWRILPTTQWNLVLLCSDITYIILKVVPRPQNILNKYIIFSKQNQQWLC